MTPPIRATEEKAAALRKLAELAQLYHDARLVRFERLKAKDLTAWYDLRSDCFQDLCSKIESSRVAMEKGAPPDPDIAWAYELLCDAVRPHPLDCPFPDAERTTAVEGVDIEEIWEKIEDLAGIHQRLLFTPNEQPLLERGPALAKWGEMMPAPAILEWIQAEWNDHVARLRRILAGFARLKAPGEGDEPPAAPVVDGLLQEPDRRVTGSELAELLGVTARTLSEWRKKMQDGYPELYPEFSETVPANMRSSGRTYSLHRTVKALKRIGRLE